VVQNIFIVHSELLGAERLREPRSEGAEPTRQRGQTAEQTGKRSQIGSCKYVPIHRFVENWKARP